jgi:hypothetical protein
LAVELRNRGLNGPADAFAYRAQVIQRRVLVREFKPLSWAFSFLLGLVAGYGYKPIRALFWYIVVIAGFSYAFFLATHGVITLGLSPSAVKPLEWYEALIVSISSFHGRGFFNPPQSLGDPVAILAAAEAVVGLMIEITFIATFTQRFFAR